jgi:1-acyl-sn-glycerol-3-phosphate acyltransferase
MRQAVAITRSHPRDPHPGRRRMASPIRMVLASLFRVLILGVVHVFAGVCLKGPGKPLGAGKPCLYFANHTSLGDFLLIWAVMPSGLRRQVRPVAAADFWMASSLRRFIALDVFNALLIERAEVGAERPQALERQGALAMMSESLQQGDSLIFFPEGTRNTTDDCMRPFKAGLFHLAQEHPEVALVPVWLDNIRHVMPKGHRLPVPTLCSVNMGLPWRCRSAADARRMDAFLDQAQKAVLALRPGMQVVSDGHADLASAPWHHAA